MPEESEIEANMTPPLADASDQADPSVSFSNEFGLSDFDRLKARIDPSTGEFEQTEHKDPRKIDDIGRVWQDLKKINYAEEVRSRAITAYAKSLPLAKRGLFMAKTMLSRDKNRDGQSPATGPISINQSTVLDPTAPHTAQPSKHTTIEIKLSAPGLPKVKLPPLPRSKDELRTYLEQLRTVIEQLWLRIPRQVWIIGAASLVVCSIGYFTIHAVVAGVTKDPTIGDSTNAKTRDGLQRGTPTYNTLLPVGKDINALGGWARVSPPDREAVWAYADKIDGIDITVSEQPMPKQFAVDTEQKVADLAINYKATDKIHAGDTTVYIGRASNGVESVILSKEKLLILIKSSNIISSDKWIGYINSLQLQ